jgi:hypothetical protein
MLQQTYKMPDGEVTTSVDRYDKAWSKFVKPIEKKLDLILESFDPNCSFIDKKTKFEKRIILSKWFVQRFNESLKVKK